MPNPKRSKISTAVPFVNTRLTTARRTVATEETVKMGIPKKALLRPKRGDPAQLGVNTRSKMERLRPIGTNTTQMGVNARGRT